MRPQLGAANSQPSTIAFGRTNLLDASGGGVVQRAQS